MGKKKPKSKTTKPSVNAAEPPFKTEMDFIAAALCTANQTVFMKLCRLCESKDGPFLNIFDADKVTAKKIDELMPFKIAENDDLPHKICFRCSAKVEELYEFIQKCIKTQNSLHTALGKKEPLTFKTKTRALWEEKLNKSNISNDDICNALIKKAMEGIKDIPLNPALSDEGESPVSQKKESKAKKELSPVTIRKEIKSKDSNVDVKSDSDVEKDVSLKQIKDKFEKKFIPSRTSRSQNPESLLDGLPDFRRTLKKSGKQNTDSKQNGPDSSDKGKKKTVKWISSEEEGSSDTEINLPVKEEKPEPVEPPKPVEAPKPPEPAKPFNIMDHISIIKVNGVGVLFQCKLCNRNFLKKDVVMTHGCSKNGGRGVPKTDFTKNIVQPEPPKASVVKYINTKIDGELGKPIESKAVENPKPEEGIKKIILGSKPKPKIGPASKIKRDESNPMIGMKVAPIEVPTPKPTTIPETPLPTPQTTPAAVPSVQFPSIPSLNSRYKLVPGPNNTFQLVEENSAKSPDKVNGDEAASKSSKKRKHDESAKASKKSKSILESDDISVAHRSKSAVPEVIDLEDSPPHETEDVKKDDQPYPVGLFSTLAHHSSMYPQPVAPPPPFTTPAMKKQSYTIVQTGNPSKLLISTKPQPPVEEPSKKRQKKLKHDSRIDGIDNKQAQPFNVTLEDAAHPKDSFFTFINVDPLLQPSYVLPTDNIIQESQISTSTQASKGNAESKDKDKYSCNMCDESFSREKKLLAHIHSHYNKMDEEDMLRERNNKKRGRK